MAKSQKDNVSNLLAAIQRKAPSGEAAAEATPKKEGKARTRKSGAKSPGLDTSASRLGKPVQFWLHDEDRRLIRELSAWLAGQGIRPSDSMVIRAALRVSRTGDELLDAYKQAAQLDGRFKRRSA